MGKLLIIIISIVVIVGGVYAYVSSTDVGVVDNETEEDVVQERGVLQGISSTLRGEEKDFEVRNQEAGSVVIVKNATLPSAGFVVVYEDAGERPGRIIAQTEFMTHGE